MKGPTRAFHRFSSYIFFKASHPLNGKHGEPAVYLRLKCKSSQNWIWFGSSGVTRFLDDFFKTILGWSWALFRGEAGISFSPYKPSRSWQHFVLGLQLASPLSKAVPFHKSLSAPFQPPSYVFPWLSLHLRNQTHTCLEPAFSATFSGWTPHSGI